MADFKRLLKSLEQGVCPPELCFNLKPDEEIDWQKVRYNTFFKSNDFYESKFPAEFENLPGFDKVIDLIVEKNKDNTPLKEIENRQKNIS